ncbi:ABC transporter, ATP-binding protein YjiK [Bordetella holmesii CDC-H635-BH]|uniref:Energy-dependent translational throttle protein EttA n=5 Tax=cellular organisms TaxID=131567 RepID=A0A158M8Q4_9BORD|nr:ABC transporter, ATP-binding protein YjiK [Bordetella holmesii CDC-H809-BH]KAK81798.1 ABC transporter, ATP-binding protein YjiK [Bordetella holmesii CDC-H572-BH]KAK90401.1 ABC transporter, ATP-binding protein YjiK [Bordetella holmesii CDC-H635-BH]KAK98890.1 ABC transporter, ATP-binding protein YjiK [Bordetella holmesii CDC-H585-BH]KCV03203.1 ABC transporter, ATP-binding protein YjiK [Bordetella holmesii CDC-H629-BH]KCV03974.1 ABC transporter, ATP-binding protein YjiK [Bordetella holmesii CD
MPAWAVTAYNPVFIRILLTESMAQYVYTMNRVGKIVPPKRQILRDISLSFFPGAKIGVLGLNGSGKSTLLKIMAGVDKEIEGEAIPMPGLNIGYLPQEPQLNPEHTVRESVEEGLGAVFNAKKRLDEVYSAYAEPDADFDALAAEQAELEAVIAAAASNGADDIEHQMEIAADALRLPPWDATVGNLSGGEKRRVALCRLLLSKPDMLLLDEPTNHLDAESVEWLEQFLHKFPGTVVAVTHDRYFLDNAAEWILELDRGHGIPWKGNYSSWLEQKEARLKQEEASESARQKTIKKELEWVRQNPKGRQAKAKARIARFEELSSYEYQKRNETQEIFIPVGDRLGNEAIEFDHVSKAYGDRLLFDDLSFKVPPGAIVGIIGPNGAGKSTLFRMLAGREQPDSGEIKRGQTVKLAYVDQSRDSLDAVKTVFDAVADGADILTVGKFEMPSRAYLGRFNFKGGDQNKIVGQLSGGERGRLHLAKTLIAGGNVLLLDEPSNDLDVETLRALEDALLEFPGSVMVISHDRWFLDRIATHILAFEGDSQVVFFDGNYQEYEADKKRRLGDEGAKPKRLRYKALK